MILHLGAEIRFFFQCISLDGLANCVANIGNDCPAAAEATEIRQQCEDRYVATGRAEQEFESRGSSFRQGVKPRAERLKVWFGPMADNGQQRSTGLNHSKTRDLGAAQEAGVRSGGAPLASQQLANDASATINKIRERAFSRTTKSLTTFSAAYRSPPPGDHPSNRSSCTTVAWEIGK